MIPSQPQVSPKSQALALGPQYTLLSVCACRAYVRMYVLCLTHLRTYVRTYVNTYKLTHLRTHTYTMWQRVVQGDVFHCERSVTVHDGP